MAIKYPLANGNWSNAANWNGGTKPVAGDDVYAGTFTVNVDENINVASLNNTAISRPIATAQMTANNAPTPFVAAASTFQSTNDPFRAFDRVYTTSTFWATSIGNATGWLSYDFASGIIIDGYTIFASNTLAANPRNWTLEGSNDNVNWTVLHTVTLPSAISAGGTYSIASIGNSTSYRYYRINVTLNGGGSQVAITELELYQPNTAALSAGGTFNFNTAGVTASVTGLTPLSVGATNLLTISHGSGSVDITIINAVLNLNLSQTTNVINYTGNGNLTITCPNISILIIRFIEKTGGGTLTINGNISMSRTSSGSGANAMRFILSTNGNIIINGDCLQIGPVDFSVLILQTGGNVTVNGNLLGGMGTNINSSGTVTINGDVYGNALTSSTIVTTVANTINITGNVYGSSNTRTINSTLAASIINIIGDVYPWGVYSELGTVTLTGNMYNSLGRNAIISPLLYISNSTTTRWVMDLGGGATKTLYSADTFPNVPAITNVRSGITYGPSLSLTGTMVVPAASDVRMNVAVSNTVGTGELTSADIISGINASADPLAVRLRTILSDKTAGNLISQYNNS